MGSEASRAREKEVNELLADGRNLYANDRWREAENKFAEGMSKTAHKWHHRGAQVSQAHCLLEMGDNSGVLKLRLQNKYSPWMDYELASELLSAEALRRSHKPTEAIATCNTILANSNKWVNDVLAAVYFVRAASEHDLKLQSAANQDWQQVVTTATDPNLVARAVAAIAAIAPSPSPPTTNKRSSTFIARIIQSVTTPPLPIQELHLPGNKTPPPLNRDERVEVAGNNLDSKCTGDSKNEYEMPMWMEQAHVTLGRNRLAYERDLKAYNSGLRGDNMPPFDQLHGQWLVYADERYLGANTNRMEAIKLTTKDCYSVLHESNKSSSK